MKKRIVWFIAGFVVSWLTWSLIVYVRQLPRDFTEVWSTEKEKQAVAPRWLKQAHGRKVGQFTVITPANPAIATAYIFSSAPNPYPCIIIEDHNADGRLDAISIADSTDQYVSLEIKTADPVFDSLTLSTGLDKSDVTFTDNNFDGQYDIRQGPEKTTAVAIEGQWYDLIRTPVPQSVKMLQTVEINGKLMRVKAVDGIWRVIEEE